MTVPQDGLPVVAFDSAETWEAWLAEHHADSGGLWLKIAKKAAPERTVTYGEALDVALCYGWIDGQKRPYDDRFWLQRFTPRTPRSKWSKLNRDRVAALAAAGRMAPAGKDEVERARADGRWEAAYDSQSTIEVPDDFRLALDANPAAREFFETLRGTSRYAFLYRIHDAKRPETRARRIGEYVAMLARGEKLR